MKSDYDLAVEALTGVLRGQSPDRLLYFVLEGAPASKARARWHLKQQRFYTPQGTIDAEGSVSASFRAVIDDEPLVANVALVAIFFRPDYQRIDADNLLKLVLDAGTRARVWMDDCQVTAQAAFVELDPDHPRTVVAFAPVVGTLDRRRAATFRCRFCKREFARDRFHHAHRGFEFCSIACAQHSRLGLARCPKCQVEFQRLSAGQRYCSKNCSLKKPRVRKPLVDQDPWPVCGDCGVRVSRREYTRCSSCSAVGRPREGAVPPVVVGAVLSPAAVRPTVLPLFSDQSPCEDGAGATNATAPDPQHP